MTFLKHIQSKSSAVKAQYAFGVSALITGIIGMVWVSTLPAKFADISISPEPIEGTEEIGNFFNDTKEQLGSVINAVSETEGVVEETQAPTTNLDMLGVPGGSDTTTTLESTTSPLQITPPSIPATTTEPVLKNETPPYILIGTTTSQKTNTKP